MIKLVQQICTHLLNARPVLSAEEYSSELGGNGCKAQWKGSERAGPCYNTLYTLPSN